jgi:hypothetical protein
MKLENQSDIYLSYKLSSELTQKTSHFMGPVYVPVSTITFAEIGYDVLDLVTILMCL